jgi:hypothetical protein
MYGGITRRTKDRRNRKRGEGGQKGNTDKRPRTDVIADKKQ